ncbi:uncharacterized protein LOC129584762 [Paramacrobiotus metropolitanus]|uniref:uncharacterized protein LOC129584762 n=1 Tax=Paramacrobiotus metropolitanus TaxID=2943436 RepID=UPI0024456DCD|nr:uncharacterized protein LOC129584762 [Paramacrobiotus metropolitanus]
MRDGSSPDLGDLLDGRRECAVESRFTSEEEGDKEEAGRRPRIVKPVRSSGGSVDGGGKKAEKGRMKKSGVPALPTGLKPPSIRGGGLVITHSAESSQGPASDSMEEAAPMRIVKQGTFTKDRPSGMVPVILPDVGGSPNRKRYGSSVRGPPHRDPLPTSSPRKLTSTPSPRPSRYPHPKSNSFPGHDVITIPPPPPPDLSSSSFPPPTPSVAPKPHPPKKSTVSSKIASLWRGKEKKPEPPPPPREMKSPTLSERAAAPGARVWGSVLAGVSATLPKMRAAEVTTFRPRFAPLNGAAKREATSEAEKDAGLTVTTV